MNPTVRATSSHSTRAVAAVASIIGRCTLAVGPALQVREVSKGYRSRGAAALEDFSLEVPAGAYLVLLGPSGCGKSPLLRCIAGVEDEGKILVGGRERRRLSSGDLRCEGLPQRAAETFVKNRSLFQNIGKRRPCPT